MTKEVHRTANGKKVDMGSLRLKNENVRAVGNMKVNARGDLVDDKNQVISSKPKQVNQNYNNQVANPRKPK
jgi:glycine cleavage system H lipoate-binding protein